MIENTGRLAHKMQPLGRMFLKALALNKIIKVGQDTNEVTASTRNKVVCQDHDDKRSRYVLQSDDVCHADDVHEFLQNEEIDVIELEVCMTIPAQREGADGYTFICTLHADDLSISGATLESNAELVRAHEVGLIQQCFYNLMVGYVRTNYLKEEAL